MSGRRPASLLWLAGLGAAILIAWALAGCFMDGQDELNHVVPRLVVLGGRVGEERVALACKLYSEGQGHQEVVLTGRNNRLFRSERAELVNRCGVDGAQVRQWPSPTNTFEELTAVAAMLRRNPAADVIVISDSLHMPRLRYLRDRLGLNGRVYLRESRLEWEPDPAYLLKAAFFWFREPVAYVYYRLRY
jgi:uncharacterized SAM-binding protein YcdF (DUF218 family)